MEIVVFEDKKWSEIPEQDNPAFDRLYEDSRLQRGYKGRKAHCLLICKRSNGYNVLEIPIWGDIISRGLFWNLNDAKIFAEALASREKEE